MSSAETVRPQINYVMKQEEDFIVGTKKLFSKFILLRLLQEN